VNAVPLRAYFAVLLIQKANKNILTIDLWYQSIKRSTTDAPGTLGRWTESMESAPNTCLKIMWIDEKSVGE